MSNIMNIALEAHQVPTIKEVKNKDWVYYGEKNIYPNYLIDIFTRSGKNNAIINNKKKICCRQWLEGCFKAQSIRRQ